MVRYNLLIALMLAAGIVAGYYLHKHQDQIIQSLSKASGMGKDFLLQQDILGYMF